MYNIGGSGYSLKPIQYRVNLDPTHLKIKEFKFNIQYFSTQFFGNIKIKIWDSVCAENENVFFSDIYLDKNTFTSFTNV